MGCEFGNCENSSTTKICYTGKDFESIPVLQGDNLTKVLENISTRVVENIKFNSIDLTKIVIGCENSLQELQGEEITLQKIVEKIYKDYCKLVQDVAYNKNFWFNKSNYPFNLGSLTTPSGKNGEIIQALLNKVNQLQVEINNLMPDINEDEDADDDEEEDNTYLEQLINNRVISILKSNLKSCSSSIRVSGVGENTTFTILHTAPDRTVLHGAYPLAWFDSNGKGRESFGMCGWYLADGRNGTIDMRGFGAVGATSMDTSRPLNVKANDAPTSLGLAIGNKEYKLKIGNVPPHTHNFFGDGHNHQVQVPNLRKVSIVGTVAPNFIPTNVAAFVNDNSPFTQINTTTNDSTGVNGGVNYPGGIAGQQGKPEAFSIIEPNRALIYIQRIDYTAGATTTPSVGGGQSSTTI